MTEFPRSFVVRRQVDASKGTESLAFMSATVSELLRKYGADSALQRGAGFNAITESRMYYLRRFWLMTDVAESIFLASDWFSKWCYTNDVIPPHFKNIILWTTFFLKMWNNTINIIS